MDRNIPTIGRKAVMAVALTLVVTGCASTRPASGLTHEQATDRVEQYILDAASSLNLVPHLVRFDDGNAPCSGPNDSIRNPDLVMYEKTYRLRDIEPVTHSEAFRQIEAYWKANGFVVIYAAGSISVSGARKVVSENKETDFRMSLAQSNDAKMLSLGAQSPCVRRPKDD